MEQTEAVPSRSDLFFAFLKIGALGFGGVAPLTRHVLVVERKILDERAFAELFGLASALPGANTVNFAVLLGDRSARLGGAAAAVGGLFVGPIACLLLLAALYDRFSSIPEVRAALAGAAAAAAGLVGGTCFRLLRGLGISLRTLTVAGAICLLVSVFRQPMVLAFALVLPLSILWKPEQAR